MKPPPLLLGVALVFWGWQSDLMLVGILLAVVLESALVVRRRLELPDEDFARIWALCSLLFVGSALYAFTVNDVPAAFSGYLDNPTFSNQRRAGGASARTAASMFRWLPMIFFPFAAASAYGGRPTVPTSIISFVVRRRLKRAKAAGEAPPRLGSFNARYAYLAATLLSASVHPGGDTTFFWGLAFLLAWTMWSLRPRRFHIVYWVVSLGAAITLGYYGQEGIGSLQGYLERVSPAWLQRFFTRGTDASYSRTAIGRIGSLKLSGKVVVRVETQPGKRPPSYLREASYRQYNNSTWYARGRAESFEGNNFNEDFQNSRIWTLMSGRRTNDIVSIACSIPGGRALLPLPVGSWQLENLNAYVLRKNDLGAVECEGPGLVIFDAHYGPGETLDSLPVLDDYGYDSVPDREIEALDEIVEQTRLRHAGSAREKMRILSKFFAEHYSYRTWQDAPSKGDTRTAMGRFLLETRAGHCEYFATAAALLMRRAHQPARYAVGYFCHEGSGQKYVVRQRDAHAWCLVWDEESRTWVDFEITPASWISEEEKLASTFEWFGDFWTRFKFELAKFRWGQSRVREYLWVLIIPGLIVLAYQIVFRRRRRKAREGGEEVEKDWPGLDSEFYRLEAALAARGFPRPAEEPLGDWLRRATDSAQFAELRPAMEKLLWLHYRHRFDPDGLPASERDALRAEARECLAAIERPQAKPPQ
jgi:hypothetical protein